MIIDRQNNTQRKVTNYYVGGKFEYLSSFVHSDGSSTRKIQGDWQ